MHFFVTTLSLMILWHCSNIVASLEWIQNGTTFDSDPTGESWKEQCWNEMVEVAIDSMFSKCIDRLAECRYFGSDTDHMK
jgi:hypothetical protein